MVCTDDRRGDRIANIALKRGIEVITVGHREADLRILAQHFSGMRQELRFEWRGRKFDTRLNLVGGFQSLNALTACGLAIATGCDPRAVFERMELITTVRGRMELAATKKNGAAIFVDYAHTPDALEKALLAARPHITGRLSVVFGAGGDRDKFKREPMGRVAAKHADSVIVTDDNPRNEDPAAIRKKIIEGCPGAREIEDRAEAILVATDSLRSGDVLLIAGKGHESGQEIGGSVYPFDDTEQASMAVRLLEGMPA